MICDLFVHELDVGLYERIESRPILEVVVEVVVHFVDVMACDQTSGQIAFDDSAIIRLIRIRLVLIGVDFDLSPTVENLLDRMA